MTTQLLRIHEIAHGRANTERFHVRGFNQQGTTTPFDMVVMNAMSRYRLCIEALRRTRRLDERSSQALQDRCAGLIAEATAYSRQHLEDAPEIRDWVWTDN